MAAHHVAAVQFPGQKRVLMQVDPLEDVLQFVASLARSLARSMVPKHFSVGMRGPADAAQRNAVMNFRHGRKRRGTKGQILAATFAFLRTSSVADAAMMNNKLDRANDKARRKKIPCPFSFPQKFPCPTRIVTYSCRNIS